jgi:hypothetical protein
MWPEVRRTGSTLKAPHRRFFPAPPPAEDRRPGLYPGEPETCRRDYHHFLPVLAHLGLMLGLYRVYHVEGRAFQMMVAFALVALPVHYLLPYRWKKPLFVAVSIAGMAWIFGVLTTLAVLAIAAVLIGICYLPVAWGVRAGLIAAIAAGCAALRPDAVGTALPNNVWPVLATIFMFRMIVYLYELKHAKKPEPLVDALGYFFMLPNNCFLHFPVVDYRTMQRSYFARDVHETQRAGLQMMFRGAVHLLLYRLVYHELLIPAEEVRDVRSLAGYLVCNYLLYLRVSGQFHTACGMLHLFGFHLPETHRNYLLATGFTDYWRRINIYWKDFMVRVVFNPVVFWLKRWPLPIALAMATAVVFVTTWVLHGYQSYWLRGEWSFSGPDTLFWGVLGVLVLVNVQLDARRSLAKPASGADPDADRGSVWSASLRGLRAVWVAGTAAVLIVALVWTALVWTAAAYQSFSAGDNTSFGAADALALIGLAVVVLLGTWAGAQRRDARAARPEPQSPGELALRMTKTAWTFATIALLWSLWTSPSVGAWLAMLRRGMAV